ncbi:hypothetical protein LAG90_13800 [Marinilongibacter aquaticus]|uniref:hypothetical protein n=1 Tax=Marinilongibacter aquaticus TaxID=2975157 RepID=UPI0021BDE322|nr:hypothetical protein [Marinilongibacter aquaticus]UBM57879.1 hypothetical protein LAG90_13800 [Marinilongibacter aquaticus]
MHTTTLHLIFLALSVVACNSVDTAKLNPKTHSASFIVDQSGKTHRLPEGERRNPAKYFAEIGIPTQANGLVRAADFSRTDRAEKVFKFKAFLQKHGEERTAEMRTAIDLAARIVLFDKGLLASTDLRDKAEKEYFVFAYLENAAVHTESIYKVMVFAKEHKLFTQEQELKMNWLIGECLKQEIEQKTKGIEHDQKELLKNRELEELYSEMIAWNKKALANFQLMQAEVKHWPKQAFNWPLGTSYWEQLNQKG